MIITDFDGVRYEEGRLKGLMERGGYKNSYRSGLLFSKDLFMIVEKTRYVTSLNEDKAPLFCFFSRRIEPDEGDFSRAVWKNHPEMQVPWLGIRLHIHDTTGDKDNNAVYLPPILQFPHRYGENYDLIVSNAMRINGVCGSKGMSRMGGGGGIVFQDNTGNGCCNMNTPGNVVLPSFKIFRDDPRFKPDHDEPIKKLDVMCSHMFIGYNSIVKGLEELEFPEIKSAFELYFKERPEYEKELKAYRERDLAQLGAIA